jgi:nitric oxide reductase subunit B
MAAHLEPASSNLNGGQQLAIKYFVLAMVLFGAQLLFGMLASIQYLAPGFLFGVMDFSINRMVHINAMVVWMLCGFIGAVYWMLQEEAGHEVVGLKLGNVAFWALTVAVAVVVLVYLLVQTGAGDETTLWLITEGREYIEAPRWADIAIVACVLVFSYNVVGTFAKGNVTGIGGVLMFDLIALVGLYLAGMFYTTNVSVDQYWWWWVIHLWVEATWEVLVGTILAYVLMHTLGVRREIVQTWLYIEVALMFGSGILGLGHHYFWIGAPEYWLSIGGFFSALEPIPLVAMVVHAVYDSGVHGVRNTNHPAFAWVIANSFGNFLGAGVWGFMHTLPQINLFTHGTQWTSSHGHLAFFGAYATINIVIFYIAAPKARGDVWMGAGMPDHGWKWKWSLALLNVGMLGMTVALLIEGYVQSQFERAIGGSTWGAYFEAQAHPWYQQALSWRTLCELLMVIGFVILVWDLMTIGKRETRIAEALEPA